MMERSVQGIALKYKEKIPEEFIRSKDEQPGITTVEGAVLEVPVIDLRNPDEEKILESIVDASQKWGMFQVVNHEIPSEVIRKLQQVGREFFELPEEEKEKEVYVKPVEVDHADTLSLEGYGTKLQREVQGMKGWVDHLFHKIWPPSAVNYHFWPKNPSYRQRISSRSTISIKFMPRGSNSLADSLAKARSDMQGERLKWSI